MNSSSKKPNILILMPDQMRADCINAAGNTSIMTPNIDRLCKEGMRFENCYSSNPVCMAEGVSPFLLTISREFGRIIMGKSPLLMTV